MAQDPAARTRLRRLLWILGPTLVVLALALAILVPNVNTEVRSQESCSSCLSSRTTVESGLWLYDTRVLDRGSTATVRESEILHELGDGVHAHRWFKNGATGFCFGRKSWVACGGWQPNPVAHAMEHEPPTRGKILAEVSRGALPKEELLRILDLPRRPRPEEVEDPARRILFQKGMDLLALSPEGTWSRWWSDALEATPPRQR